MEPEKTNDTVTQQLIEESHDTANANSSPQPHDDTNNNATNDSNNKKKRSNEHINLNCYEKMPKMQTFSRFRPPQLLPHQIIMAAYSTLMRGGGFSDQPPCQLLHNYPSLSDSLAVLVPWKHGPKREKVEPNNNFNKTIIHQLQEPDGVRMRKELEQIPEVLRMQTHGFSAEALLEFPLSYDWAGPLGLGTTTGSAAFNRFLLQVAAMHPEYYKNVPQLTSEEFYMALQYASQQADTEQLISPFIDEPTREIDEQLRKVDDLKTPYKFKSPAQMRQILAQFHSRAAELRQKQTRLEDSDKDLVIPKPSSTTTESESLAQPEKGAKSIPALPWPKAISSLLVENGYKDENAFCSPNDLLF